jgi:cysteinyl-tRNA synthetase
MKLYNTRMRDFEDLKTLDNNKVRIYSCGPTVYDHAHIGNLSAYIFADTLRRVAKLSGFHVLHAMNYTDVDDKTIRRSHEKYPDDEPKAALKKLTDKYIKLFLDDMEKIGNNVDALTFLRATDDKVIDGMRQLITKLHAGGFAYIADDGVYFSIEAYRKSGKTYGQLLELTLENTSEARIQNDEYDKESAHDFALWKKQKVDEPAWEFTLDGHDLIGRPGWHIECSVMSRQALGQPFDIHTGGVDLIFPHHENEIAQSTAGEFNPIMSQIFAHNEHILVDGKKMAKSANNFYTLRDIGDKGYDPLAFRLLVLQAHYRSQAHFSWENLEAAQNRLKTLQAFADLRFQPITSGSYEISELDYLEYAKGMRTALFDDLNTPQALRTFALLVDERKNSIHENELDEFKTFLRFVDNTLGLRLLTSEVIDADLSAIITEREKAREAKDWAKSDELRDKLQEQGIGLRDTANGTIWFRT